MGVKIKTLQLPEGGWIAKADESFNFVVGFPGTVKYGDTKDEAHDKLKNYLTQRGFEVVD